MGGTCDCSQGLEALQDKKSKIIVAMGIAGEPVDLFRQSGPDPGG